MTAKLTLKNAPKDSESNKLDTSDFDKVLDALSQDNVVTLALTIEMLTPENMQELAQVLPGRENLEDVKLSGARKGEALSALYSALLEVHNLRELDISSSFVGREHSGEVANLVAHHQQLEVLNITYNNFQLPGTEDLAPCIAHNGGLRELNASFNAMQSPGVDLMAEALETNKGLVKINLDTSYNIELSTPNIERMLQTNKNLVECGGLTSPIIEERLAQNLAEGQKLAEAMATDPEAMSQEEYVGLGERLALTTYLLKSEKGMSKEEMNESLSKALIAGEKQGVDIFPSMMAVLPFGEMLELSASRGKPLTANDFYSEKDGASPLLEAAIERGAAPQIFNLSMGWKNAGQLMGAYRELPESQRSQVTNINQMRAQLSTNDKGIGRRMLG